MGEIRRERQEYINKSKGSKSYGGGKEAWEAGWGVGIRVGKISPESP